MAWNNTTSRHRDLPRDSYSNRKTTTNLTSMSMAVFKKKLTCSILMKLAKKKISILKNCKFSSTWIQSLNGCQNWHRSHLMQISSHFLRSRGNSKNPKPFIRHILKLIYLRGLRIGFRLGKLISKNTFLALKIQTSKIYKQWLWTLQSRSWSHLEVVLKKLKRLK